MQPTVLIWDMAKLKAYWTAGKIVRAPSGVVHGKRGIIHYNESQEDSLFKGLPK